MTGADGFAEHSREQVMGLLPFTVRRVARWTECDPAGVVYAGNFTEYLLSAVHLFRRHLFGRDWNQVRAEWNVDLPAKATSLVYQGSLWPDDVFDTALWVGTVRTRTFDILARARRHDGAGPVFVGRYATICVSAADRRVAVPMPGPLQAMLGIGATRSPAPQELLEMRW